MQAFDVLYYVCGKVSRQIHVCFGMDNNMLKTEVLLVCRFSKV